MHDLNRPPAGQVSHPAAVAVRKPAELLLFSLTDLQQAPRTVPLPGTVSHLSLAKPGGPVLAPVSTANQVVDSKDATPAS